MATDVSSVPVNGNYGMHQGYGSLDQQNAYAYANGPSAQPSAAQASPASSQPATAHNQQLSKDEVGWYFVETYYTTLSRSPEKLYLFYNKRSQFVSGQETDKVTVCVGQRAINDRIKELDYHDCKVRVTNVDSQASDNNIVIQVIGEISNRSQPHKKFTQTFVLATQTNGYFVLNDIFRYLIDEEDEPEPETEAAPSIEQTQQVQDAEPAAPEPATTAVEEAEPKTLTSSMDPVAVEHDAQKVDKEIEDKVLNEPATVAEPKESETVNGVSAHGAADETTADVVEPTYEAEPEPSSTVEALASTEKEADVTPEKPKDPEPTPAASPPKQAPAQPAAAPKPAVPKPKTWSMIAGSANSRPAASSTPSAAAPQTAPTPAPASKPQAAARAPAPTPPAQTPAANVPTAPAAQRAETPVGGEQDEWTSVGGNHNRQQSRQVNGPQQQEAPQHRAFIKGVTEAVAPHELKSELEKYGEVIYFDISRQKNQAFIEFRTAEGYNAAVNANPHTVNGERLLVEERRYKPQYNNRGPYGGRGRGGMNQGPPRGNFQGRGGFPPRGGRGNGPAPARGGGRGGPQAA